MSFTDPVPYVTYTFLWLALLSALAIIFHERVDKSTQKKFLFLLMVVPVTLAVFYLSGHTVYKNVLSETNGPVHWHMDYQAYVCGERLDLIDPSFPKNKIGSPLLHEHNDDRVHLEGTPKTLQEASLGNYFSTIGGHVDATSFSYNDKNGFADVKNGDTCNGEPATLKVYVNGKRLADPANYIYYPDSLVPPGDCTIILFDSSDEDTTTHICESWAVNDWEYDSYEREPRTIGGHTWQ